MRKIIFLMALAVMPSAWAHHASSCDVAVISGGVERPEYFARGTTYVEALRGRNYTLRVRNPTPYRVAVALSVDGLNTIDAQHTSGWNAAKWVLDPYESIDIDGWQVSDSAARRFVFTGERRSYGAALGQTENLGVIEAIFYRERLREVQLYRHGVEREEGVAGGVMGSTEAPAPPASAEARPRLSDDYAATGMGDRKRHDVTTVDIDLDPSPIASVRIRYEFRPQLVKLGILPSDPSPIERREKARGFERYCPEPN